MDSSSIPVSFCYFNNLCAFFVKLVGLSRECSREFWHLLGYFNGNFLNYYILLTIGKVEIHLISTIILELIQITLQ